MRPRRPVSAHALGDGGLRAAGDAELAQDRRDVHARGLAADEQPLADLLERMSHFQRVVAAFQLAGACDEDQFVAAANADGLAIFIGSFDHGLEIVIVLFAHPDVAGIDAILIESARAIGILYEQLRGQYPRFQKSGSDYESG